MALLDDYTSEQLAAMKPNERKMLEREALKKAKSDKKKDKTDRQKTFAAEIEVQDCLPQLDYVACTECKLPAEYCVLVTKCQRKRLFPDRFKSNKDPEDEPWQLMTALEKRKQKINVPLNRKLLPGEVRFRLKKANRQMYVVIINLESHGKTLQKWQTILVKKLAGSVHITEENLLPSRPNVLAASGNDINRVIQLVNSELESSPIYFPTIATTLK